jgi:hypothetical protein
MQAREVHKAVALVVGRPSRRIASLCDEIGKSQFCRERATMLLVRSKKPLRLFWMISIAASTFHAPMRNHRFGDATVVVGLTIRARTARP